MKGKMTKRDGIIFLFCTVLGIGAGILLLGADWHLAGKMVDLSQTVDIEKIPDAAGYPFEENTKGKYGKININTAGIAELDELPGIGEKMAERIIIFRNTVAPFGVPEEIMRVAGIGEKVYEELKDQICVE